MISERSSSVVECLNRDLEIAVQATSALYSLLSTGLTKENPSRHTWKFVDSDVKNQIKWKKMKS